MSSSLSTLTAAPPAGVALPAPPLNLEQFAEIVNDLRAWFATDWDIFDGRSGAVLHRTSPCANFDDSLRNQLCVEVAARDKHEFIDEHEPVVILALPIRIARTTSVVAVAAFATRPRRAGDDVAALARLLNTSPSRAEHWLHEQRPWAADTLLTMAGLAKAKIDAQIANEQLEQEVEQLSLHLSTTYEEISLLYRLTQNLRLSSSDDELGTLALEWLADVLPAESLAVQLLGMADDGITGEASPKLVSHGPCPLDCEQFSRLVSHFGSAAQQRALIVNRVASRERGWPFGAVRDVILVPLTEGNNTFGWLAAFNHSTGGEFGSVEASLLGSVGAIFGIHCGNAELYRQQREFLAGVVRALTSAIDAKDPYTCGHSDRVARVAVRIAKEMGCDADQLNTIYLSGLLHDVGKIGIDDNVLRKPGKLTEAEYEHIKQHAEIGYKILVDLKQLDQVLPVVLHHHEQWDGKGYPHGLAGEETPLLARIVAVADSFDAMGSDRPYRKGLARDILEEILRDGAGSQWDPQVINAFFRARDEIREIWTRERRNLGLDVQQWI